MGYMYICGIKPKLSMVSIPGLHIINAYPFKPSPEACRVTGRYFFCKTAMDMRFESLQIGMSAPSWLSSVEELHKCEQSLGTIYTPGYSPQSGPRLAPYKHGALELLRTSTDISVQGRKERNTNRCPQDPRLHLGCSTWTVLKFCLRQHSFGSSFEKGT